MQLIIDFLGENGVALNETGPQFPFLICKVFVENNIARFFPDISSPPFLFCFNQLGNV